MKTQRNNRKNMNKRFYKMLSVILAVAIMVVAIILLTSNGESKASQLPNQATQAIQAKQLIGKWIEPTSQMFLDIKSNGKVTEGVVGNESEGYIYNYSISGSTFTIKYKEGKSGIATFTIENGNKLILQYSNNDKRIFFSS